MNRAQRRAARSARPSARVDFLDGLDGLTFIRFGQGDPHDCPVCREFGIDLGGA